MQRESETSERTSERTKAEKREHHPCDGWVVVAATVDVVIAVFFSPFLICHLFVVKTVHSAKLRAFYGARRYFPLQFHYFRVCLFFGTEQRGETIERCRTATGISHTHTHTSRRTCRARGRATAVADRPNRPKAKMAENKNMISTDG